MNLGDTLVFKSDLYDGPFVTGQPAPNLVNATTATLTITLPDGTTVTPTITNPPAVTGKYTYSYVVSPTGQSGHYVGQWYFTMSGGATTSFPQSFDVGTAVVTADEALTHLRANGIIQATVDQDYLEWLCTVATDAIERDLGIAVVRKTAVDTFDGGKNAVALRSSPTISITTVVDSGTTVSSTDYLLDKNANILYRGNNGYSLFSWGRQNIVVTYLVGLSGSGLETVRKVALNAVQAMWQDSQQMSHPRITEFADTSVLASQSVLTPLERAAYESLRAVGIG